MVEVYVNLIQCGLRSIEKVPKLWRAAVQARLDEIAAENAGGDEANG